ncbi:hypothetical protein F2P81_002740 [Scophthalmus maximus]|uniref:Uncharacterized protein n=1 Tax=Scophthalmus maximus TaxID=52904 RepID=A0A6A4TU47_SCOMX|nr:hypothetical protein F2P81_002740 [Scophthalmus maximus]
MMLPEVSNNMAARGKEAVKFSVNYRTLSLWNHKSLSLCFERYKRKNRDTIVPQLFLPAQPPAAAALSTWCTIGHGSLRKNSEETAQLHTDCPDCLRQPCWPIFTAAVAGDDERSSAAETRSGHVVLMCSGSGSSSSAAPLIEAQSVNPKLKTPLGRVSHASADSSARQLCKSASLFLAPLKKTIWVVSGSDENLFLNEARQRQRRQKTFVKLQNGPTVDGERVYESVCVTRSVRGEIDSPSNAESILSL